MTVYLPYDKPVRVGRLLRRYKRFLADVRFDDGEEVVAHCPNTGSMRGLLESEQRCLVTCHNDPKRKLQFTLEQLEIDGGWVMVNTARPNRVVEAAILGGHIPELSTFETLLREQKYGSQNSRIDLLLLREGQLAPGAKEKTVKGKLLRPATHGTYVEVKNVTLVEQGRARFPDAVSTRGTKHLRELAEVVAEGHRGVLFFHVGHHGGDVVEAAADIDPNYAETLRWAVSQGVEVMAYRGEVSEAGLGLGAAVPVSIS